MQPTRPQIIIFCLLKSFQPSGYNGTPLFHEYSSSFTVNVLFSCCCDNILLIFLTFVNLHLVIKKESISKREFRNHFLSRLIFSKGCAALNMPWICLRMITFITIAVVSNANSLNSRLIFVGVNMHDKSIAGLRPLSFLLRNMAICPLATIVLNYILLD